MTPAEFQAHNSGKLKEILDSQFGKELLTILQVLRPAYEFPVHEHLMTANREAIRGYDMCLRNIVSLALPPKVVTQPEANYGVEDKKTKE